jgi:hypothetical protein
MRVMLLRTTAEVMSQLARRLNLRTYERFGGMLLDWSTTLLVWRVEWWRGDLRLFGAESEAACSLADCCCCAFEGAC